MATRANWIATNLISQQATATTVCSGWSCATCGLVIGGAPITERPGPCPVCAAAAGKVVALVPTDGNKMSMLVLDGRLFELIENYRVAKRAHERESVVQAAIGHAGNYDLDDDMTVSAEIEASAAREQISAFALADATVDSTRGSRNSRPSLH